MDVLRLGVCARGAAVVVHLAAARPACVLLLLCLSR